MKNNLFQTLKILLAAIVLSFGISYIYAWTAPTATPPNNNTPEPLNTGTTNQVKSGGLGVGAFTADSALFNGDVTATGNLTVGGTVKVADTSATCDSTTEGQIKFDGSTFFGCVNTGTWEELTQGPLLLTISSDTSNYNIASFGIPEPRNIILTINSGVTVSSTNPGTPALSTGSLPSGTTVTIINNGTIVGAAGAGGAGGSITDGGDNPALMTPGEPGGSGGVAVYSSLPSIDIDNNGTIIGGGGGGGGGGGAWCLDSYYDGDLYTWIYESKCGAGGGAGGGGGVISGSGAGGGTIRYCNGNIGNSGNNGNSVSGGSGGSGGYYAGGNSDGVAQGGVGGRGGDRGRSGASGGNASVSSCAVNSKITPPGEGGNPGQAVVGNVQWL